MAKSKTKLPKGLSLHASGQYRADIDDKTLYLGTNSKEAAEKLDLYKTTKLLWSRQYHQYVKEIAGTIRTFGTTPEQAKANYERFIADNWQQGPEPEPAPIISHSVGDSLYEVKTIADVANAYASWCYQNRSAKHAKDAESVFRHMGKFLGKERPIASLTASNLSEYRRHCLKTLGSRFNKHMYIPKAAFRRCRKEQWLYISKGWVEDLLDPLEQKTIVSQETPIFTPGEIKLVLDNSSQQLESIVTLALNCALGNKDISDLRWHDIDFDNQIMNYRRPKTHKMRRTPLWPETLNLLSVWKILRSPREDNEYVFTTKSGNPWVRTIIKGNKITPDDALGKEFTKLLNELKIKRHRLGFYSIRHTATTWATEYADNDQLVKEGNEFLLGHASDEMWKRYSHAIPPSLKNAVAAVHRGWRSAYIEKES